MTKVGFISLGCSKNQVDTEVMIATLQKQGYEITPDETEADVLIINTCGFIDSAKKESIDTILEAASLKEEGSLTGIVVTGCLAERFRQEMMDALPEIDAAIGVGSLSRIGEAVESVLKQVPYTAFEDKATCPLGGDRVLTTPNFSAYLKIAEGCDNRCTYCAIPLIRGGLRSRPMEDLVKEAKTLEAMGCQELNLIAQDTSRYGLDLYGEYSLAPLVRRLCEETKIPWIRLLYCYPDKITDDLIEELRTNPRLVPYMDIPIQHINDGILSRMNRHGDSKLIKATVKKLREAVPGITLRTTAIVGFPGETEEDFRELCEYLKEAKFDRFGAFPYSPEEDTPAASFPQQLDEQVKQDRYDIIMKTQLPIAEEIQGRKIGKVIPVLCEGYDTVAEVHYARSAADAPDVDGKVYFKSKTRIPSGTFVNVKITDALDYDLAGVLEKE